MDRATVVGLFADPVVLAGGLAGLLSMWAYIPYMRDTLAGRTRPDRACWLIWAVLASLSGASNLAEGASASLFFIGVQVAGTVAIFALSIPFGAGAYFCRWNSSLLAAAALGLGIWWMTSEPVWALAMSIGVSAIGGVNTVRKVFYAPETETRLTWQISALAAGLGIFAVGAIDPVLLAYPVYLLVLYLSILCAQTWGERRWDRVWMQSVVWYSRRRAANRALMVPLPVRVADPTPIRMPPPAVMPALH